MASQEPTEEPQQAPVCFTSIVVALSPHALLPIDHATVLRREHSPVELWPFSTNTKIRVLQAKTEEQASGAELEAALEDLVNTISNKFAGISSEMFAKSS